MRPSWAGGAAGVVVLGDGADCEICHSATRSDATDTTATSAAMPALIRWGAITQPATIDTTATADSQCNQPRNCGLIIPTLEAVTRALERG